ncbi:MAG: hypothetical protein A3A86_02145 [Elusimicrobia bacterium RIFCSPLOWO2_01_FULL_60_11]|nr:MAG: hypothetical protein A3A86_02145 [Elusimicrobia bacterium RIFCSPLOWO2_01_FULL_60_11]
MKIPYPFVRLKESLAQDGLHTTVQKILHRVKAGKFRVRERYFQGADRDPDKVYRLWREKNALAAGDIEKMKEASHKLSYRPIMSIVIPVYKPDLHFFRRAVESVRGQAYPFWELCFCDDGSRDAAVGRTLRDLAGNDARIKLRVETKNGGIVSASQKAAGLARGEFIAFMDQDDLLSQDALFRVAELLNRDPSLDLIYSDNDKVDLSETHGEVYFKPDYSPDEFFCHNYIGHLSVLRKKIFDGIGGFLPGFDGAQDFEVLLRAVERTDRVAHLPYVLYSWRKTPGSTASSPAAKRYAYESGKRALEEFFRRKGEEVRVEETDEQGLYRCRFPVKGDPKVSVIRSPGAASGERARTFNRMAREAAGDHLIFLGEGLSPARPDWVESLLEPLQRNGVGIVGAKILGQGGAIREGGKVLGLQGQVGAAFRGVPENALIYNQPHRLIRNCSAVSWDAMLVSKELFERLGGFDEDMGDDYADADFCLRARRLGIWIVWTPFSVLRSSKAAERNAHGADPARANNFREKWKDVLARPDPFYNVNLSLRYTDFSPEVEG